MVYRPRRPRRIIAAWNCFNALIASLVLVLVLPVEAGIEWRSPCRSSPPPGSGRSGCTSRARRLFGSSRVDLCLWFDRRDGRPVPASVTQSPGPDGQPLTDALTLVRNGARLPFSAPAGTQWHRKGSDSWQVAGS